MQVLQSGELRREAQPAAKEFDELQEWGKFLCEDFEAGSGNASSSFGLPASSQPMLLPIAEGQFFEESEPGVRKEAVEGETDEKRRHRKSRRKHRRSADGVEQREVDRPSGAKGLPLEDQDKCHQDFLARLDQDQKFFLKRLSTLVRR